MRDLEVISDFGEVTSDSAARLAQNIPINNKKPAISGFFIPIQY